jgi:predicted ABC-type ATPase
MPPEPPPSVVILSGPNGAGKSTAAPRLLTGALAVSEFVNADTVARGLSAFGPESVALASGRIVLERIRHLADRRVSFAFETTLASRLFAPWVAGLKEGGYRFCLLFLWLPSADLAVRRVTERVKAGGHSAGTARNRVCDGPRPRCHDGGGGRSSCALT